MAVEICGVPMKRAAAILIALATTASVLSIVHAARSESESVEATQRRVRGVITAVDPATVTISPIQSHRQCITGRIDPTRTRILVDGHPGRPSDLRITYTVRAELSLDDVWMTIRVDSR